MGSNLIFCVLLSGFDTKEYILDVLLLSSLRIYEKILVKHSSMEQDKCTLKFQI